MLHVPPVRDPAIAQRIEAFRAQFKEVRESAGRVILGKDDVIFKCLVVLTAKGHILLKDVPGTGKTMLARAISASIASEFRRIQFTPDLLPMDITGTNVFDLRQKQFVFQPGPVFCNLLLADELNRATPKTQSALLESMAEGQVTVEGVTHKLAPPFLVMATMNPLDHDGTYVLPQAQLDRFTAQLSMGFPNAEAEMQMLDVHLGSRAPVDEVRPGDLPRLAGPRHAHLPRRGGETFPRAPREHDPRRLPRAGAPLPPRDPHARACRAGARHEPGPGLRHPGRRARAGPRRAGPPHDHLG